MQLSGVGLEGEAKEQFNGNQMKLAELSTAFSNNLLDATKAYSMLITEPAQVEGLGLGLGLRLGLGLGLGLGYRTNPDEP